LAPQTSGLLPPKHALADCIDQPEQEDADEDQHLYETKHTEILENDRPGKYEYGLYVKDDKKQTEHVVADVALAPTGADRVNSTLVGELLCRGRVVRSKNRGDTQHPEDQDGPKGREGAHCQIALEVRAQRRRVYA